MFGYKTNRGNRSVLTVTCDYKNKCPSVGLSTKAEGKMMSNQWSFPRDSYHPTVIQACMEWFGSFSMADILDTIDSLNSGSLPKSLKTIAFTKPVTPSVERVLQAEPL